MSSSNSRVHYLCVTSTLCFACGRPKSASRESDNKGSALNLDVESKQLRSSYVIAAVGLPFYGSNLSFYVSLCQQKSLD